MQRQSAMQRLSPCSKSTAPHSAFSSIPGWAFLTSAIPLRAVPADENRRRRSRDEGCVSLIAETSAAANWPRIAGVIGARNLTSRSGANARPPACVAHVNPPLTFPWPHNIVSRWSPKSMACGLAAPRVLARFLPATICGLLCRRKPPEVRSHHRFAFSFDAHALSQPATSPG